jgi:hypothetical protein
MNDLGFAQRMLASLRQVLLLGEATPWRARWKC